MAKVNRNMLRSFLSDPNGPVARDIARRTIRVQSRARQLCPVDTGRLRSSISHQVKIENGIPVGIVGTNVKYARWVHDGRGPITAKPGKVLAFKPKGSNAVVFARSVGPAKGQPFLTKALEAARK